jgi:16S rRNA (cytidine1402-2'-O)-methyltransferase
MPDESSENPPKRTAAGDDAPRGDEADAPAPPGGLVLVSTPIGNLGDMTPRGIAALRDADLVLCEDTRVTSRLFAAHGIASRLVALHEHNEDARIPATLAALRRGERVAVVSDAGTPLISDPGFRLLRAAVAAGVPVSAVPGANAAVLALVLSGLPPHPFLFLGFPPARKTARRNAFARLRDAERAGLDATLLWYEAPHRLAETLADMADIFGGRSAAVARELTKKFEEVRRGALPDLASHYATSAARGEITVVVAPAPAEPAATDDLDSHLLAALGRARLRDAVAEVTAATGLPRRSVYARALALARGVETDVGDAEDGAAEQMPSG